MDSSADLLCVILGSPRWLSIWECLGGAQLVTLPEQLLAAKAQDPQREEMFLEHPGSLYNQLK